MAKNLKLKIKNTQIAAAVSLSGLKEKIEKTKETNKSKKPDPKKGDVKLKAKEEPKVPKEPVLRARARSRSVFSEQGVALEPEVEKAELTPGMEAVEEVTTPSQEETIEVVAPSEELHEEVSLPEPAPVSLQEPAPLVPPPIEPAADFPKPAPAVLEKPKEMPKPVESRPVFRRHEPMRSARPELSSLPTREKLGPTGRHVRDLVPPKPRPAPPRPHHTGQGAAASSPSSVDNQESRKAKSRGNERAASPDPQVKTASEDEAKKNAKAPRFKEYQDLKPAKRNEGPRVFDARDRQGLRDTEEEQSWRRRRGKQQRAVQETVTTRPTTLKIRLPITIKDLAVEMKLKASQLIEKLFLQGMIHTINDFLDDETLVVLLGQELGCAITIDTSEEERIRITGKSIKEEVSLTKSEELVQRPPVVAFMGHVDHGKTSLIDAIRKSNRASAEAGAITQHIGAFQCHTPVGDLTILDTPGHEAFSAMRARGADVTDIVVLVIAGDEGMRQQTIEALEQAKAANVSILVAINKCDKPNFNAETVYRQLAEQELLPEVWGGQVITVNCSAVTGEGIQTLLEMLALQSEVLELKADPNTRARGRVLESEMHKGMGATATVLIQNGTLRRGDSLVFDQHWGRVKTMKDDFGLNIEEALPSKPVEITGLSGLPEAGQEFIVVSSEREAREIAEKRMIGFQQNRMQQGKRISMENLVAQASDADKKILNLILLADVQGSLEALQVSLKKIKSDKVIVNIISTGVGEISESDVQLAATSKAVIIGFHSAVESHADLLVKQTGVQVRLHEIIYHAIDDVKVLMAGLLDRIAIETEKGKVEVLELFKSSQLGTISGCRVLEGSVARSHQVRVRRNQEVVWKGGILSLKRVKEDVREVQKGFECGVILQGFKETMVGDILEAYEISYIAQEL